MRHHISAIGRRDLLGVAIAAFVVPIHSLAAGWCPSHGHRIGTNLLDPFWTKLRPRR
jgi:hypothetical protein